MWFFPPPPDLTDDYLTLVMAEALLEECLLENLELLRSLTPLLDKTQAKLCRAKSLLNAVLSRGCLMVSLEGRVLPACISPGGTGSVLSPPSSLGT